MAVKKSVDVDKSDNNSDYSHLKWPAIIMAILVVIGIALFDHCTRQGTI